MVSAHAVELKEGWFDMKGLMKYSAIGMASRGLDKMGGGKNAGFKFGLAPGLYHRKKKEDEEEEKAAGMKKGGMVKKGYHKMPDGRIMKDSAHKKMTKKSTASKRADGICKKGKTKGRMC